MKPLLVFSFLFFTSLLSAQSKSTCAELEGVWQYDLPTERGMFFCSNNRYVWVLIPKDRKPFAAEQPTSAEKATAFDYLNISTGTFACDGKRVTATHLYTKNPKESGQSFQFDYEKKDGKIKYWVIQADGSRGVEGNSYKIADFKAATQNGCDRMNGFWEYDLPDHHGIFVHSGGYYSWIWVQKKFWDSKPAISSLESKALAFDNIIATAGTVNCDNQGRYTWNRIHAKNYRAESYFFSSENEFKNDTMYYWNLDTNGKRIEPSGKNIRLK